MPYLNSFDVPVPDQRKSLAFRFRLRTLMCGMAACSALFATMMFVGPLWSLAISFVGMIVGAHVAGNAIGTSLRSKATGRRTRPVPSVPTAVRDAPRPHLQHRTRLGRLTTVFTLAGAACGILVGRLLFSVVDRGQFTLADWMLGLASFAVIAGWLGFMASSFFRIGCVPAVVCFFARPRREADERPTV